MTEAEIFSAVQQELSEKRFRHTLGCVKMAERLAVHYGADASLARRAAYLHDIAKEIPHSEQLLFLQNFDIILTDLQKSRELIHAYTGAIIAKTRFGECEEVCEAIRSHTTACKGMTLLQKIIWLSDLIEDGRDFEGIGDIRSLAFSDLSAALILAYNTTISYLIKKNCAIEPGLVEARNYEIASRKEFLANEQNQR